MTTQTEALKLALELLAVGTFHSPELQAKRTEVIEKGLNALAQPAVSPTHKQEPVAIVIEVNKVGAVALRMSADVTVGTRLYTTPPQRKPLTVDDSGWYWLSENECIHVDLIRKVEAAHGIKGDA